MVICSRSFHAFFYPHGVRCSSGYVYRPLCGYLQPTALYNHPDNSPHHWDGHHHCLEKYDAYVPLLFLLKDLPFCDHNTLTHSYCLHSDLIKLLSADTCLNSILGLFVITSTFGMDSLLIMTFYMLILHTVLGIASGAGRWRAFNTCVSHICAVLVYYVPMISLSLLHRFGWHLPSLLQTVMANAYLFFPPLVNPIVYSMKTKEICNSILRTLSRKRGEI